MKKIASRVALKFGKTIASKRKVLDISQESLSTKAGVHRTYIGMVERGEKNVTIETVAKFAKAFKVKSKDLIDF